MVRYKSIPTLAWVGLCAVAILAALAGLAASAGQEAAAISQAADHTGLPKGSDKTYRVRWLPEARIALDGRTDDPAWAKAVPETGFPFPWKKAPAPATEFRALSDGRHLYFTFRVRDDDIVVLDRLRDEEDAVFEDRVELYFGRDEEMKDYYCLEVDSRGRIFDYRATYPRQFDPKWNLEGMAAKALALPQGYELECRVPLRAFAELGFPSLRPGVKVRCGLYRAEFSHDRSGKPVEPAASIHTMGRTLEGLPPIEEWLSWVDPKTQEPDFHVPSSMGWMEIVK